MHNTTEKEEKRLLSLMLQNHEELRRRTGRTSRMVEEAVACALGTREPVVLVGRGEAATAALVKRAHEHIDETLQIEGKWLKDLITGVSYSKEEGKKLVRSKTHGAVFQDHFVLLERTLEEIEKL